MKRIEHIGIAVKSLSNSIPIFEKLLNTNCYKTEVVESEKVNTAFFAVGESKVELLEGTDEMSVINSFIEKRGEGVHHLAFLVDDIEAEVQRLTSEGFVPISTSPKKGADNKLVFFFHPKSTNGILIEICQNID